MNFVAITYDSLISYPVSNKDLFFPCLYNRFLTNPFLLNNWNTLHCSLCYSLSVFSVNLISLVKRPQCKGNLVILIEILDLFEYICITLYFLGKTKDIRDPYVIIIRIPYNIYRQRPLIKLRPLIFRARDFCRKWRLNGALRALTNRQVIWKYSKCLKGSPGILQVRLFMFLVKKPNCRTFVRIWDSR